jgi:hypothetical protein
MFVPSVSQTLEKEMAARKDRHSPHLIFSRSAVKPHGSAENQL